jgi:hypothetical protein
VYEALRPGGVLTYLMLRSRDRLLAAARGRRQGLGDLIRGRSTAGSADPAHDAFRKVGKVYRTTEEVQRPYRPDDLARNLRELGFAVRVQREYGRMPLPAAHAAIVATKPRAD